MHWCVLVSDVTDPMLAVNEAASLAAMDTQTTVKLPTTLCCLRTALHYPITCQAFLVYSPYSSCLHSSQLASLLDCFLSFSIWFNVIELANRIAFERDVTFGVQSRIDWLAGSSRNYHSTHILPTSHSTVTASCVRSLQYTTYMASVQHFQKHYISTQCFIHWPTVT